MSLSLWLRNVLRVPGPKELGWSDGDWLGMREFTPFQEGKTWEDWEEHVRKHYPVRFFLSDTLPDLFRPIWGKLDRAWYWLKCHLLPSHRWHKFDLRGIDPMDSYTHGYVDPCTVMWLAAWGSLRRYVEKCRPVDPATWEPDDQMAEIQADRKRVYDEVMDLHFWWMEGRHVEEEREKKLYDRVRAATKAHDREAHDAAVGPWLEYHRWREEHAEEMFIRLCKVRQYLWD